MTKASSIRTVETLSCDAGWRNYHFVKLTTDDGIVGWSEFDEGFGSPGVGAVIERLVGAGGRPERRSQHERIYAELYCRDPAGRRRRCRAGAWARSRTRCSTPRPRRSACPATSCSAARSATASGSTGRIAPPGASIIPTGYKPRDHRSRRRQGDRPRGARERLHRAEDQHLHLRRDGKPQGWRPGFGAPFEPELNVDRKVLRNLRMHLEAIRDGAGPDVDLLLDLNFNAKTEGYLKILRAIADIDMFWVEIDSFNPRGARLHPPPEPASDLVLRDAAGLARIPALFPRTGDGRRDHRHAVERRVAVDEDRRRRRGARGQRRAA